jgi:xanthine dehydrogenase YagT iron-sulfur-binding subunit
MAKHEDDSFKPMTSLEKLSRRAFLSRTSAVGVATAAAAIAAPVNRRAAKPRTQRIKRP